MEILTIVGRGVEFFTVVLSSFSVTLKRLLIFAKLVRIDTELMQSCHIFQQYENEKFNGRFQGPKYLVNYIHFTSFFSYSYTNISKHQIMTGIFEIQIHGIMRQDKIMGKMHVANVKKACRYVPQL